jgi:hypothetical protein
VTPNTFARRMVLVTPILVTASTFCNNNSTFVHAEEFNNPGKSFLQNFGLGSPDIYYPRYSSFFLSMYVCIFGVANGNGGLEIVET